MAKPFANSYMASTRAAIVRAKINCRELIRTIAHNPKNLSWDHSSLAGVKQTFEEGSLNYRICENPAADHL